MVSSNPEVILLNSPVPSLNDLDEESVIDTVYLCKFKQGDGGQADVWFA